MKTIIRVTYRKNGVKYSTPLPNMSNESVYVYMLTKQVGRSDVLKIEREQVRA